MLNTLAHILMWAGGTIAVMTVLTFWFVLMIAVFDMAVDPMIQDVRKHPLIRNIINKIEEYRNARS